MTAKQPNATAYNPNSLKLAEVASYRRLIGAPIDRVWENVLDWEHLPWLHRTSFDYVELDEGGQWGWRTWSNAEHTGHVELTRADESNYVARTYQGDKQLSEIWTELQPSENNTRIHVRFCFPDVAEASRDSLGDAITRLYTQLWDEDEAMMIARHQRLLEERDNWTEANLGPETDLRLRLQSGDIVTFQVARREFQLRESDGELIAHSSICPHLLGPLTTSPLEENTLECPWHGYRFDVSTGACVSPATATCKLAPPPALIVLDGDLIARSR